MAENNSPAQMVQSDITYRELLVKLKTHAARLANQMDAMLCVQWIQKLQTLTQADEIKLRNYLLLQICNQISTGYLDHPFINSSYLDQDLTVVANCCRECEPICNANEDIFKMRLDRSLSNVTNIASDFYISDVDGTVAAIQTFFDREKTGWGEPNVLFAKPIGNVLPGQNFYQKKYEETLADLKEARLKLYLKDSRSLAEFINYLGENFIEKYQKATDELISIEKSHNPCKEFLTFKLNFCSQLKFLCGDLMDAGVAQNLLRWEDQFQQIQYRILCNGCVEPNESKKELISTDSATISTDGNANTKYSEYLKRYIRKQQKQFNRKVQEYETQITALKNEICLRDKKQSRQIIEMKCENIIKNEQKARDQLSESINDLESKYKSIVQQIFNDLQDQN